MTQSTSKARHDFQVQQRRSDLCFNAHFAQFLIANFVAASTFFSAGEHFHVCDEKLQESGSFADRSPSSLDSSLVLKVHNLLHNLSYRS